MSTVIHREREIIFDPIANVYIKQPLICHQDVYITQVENVDTPLMTLGANGVIRVSHIDTNTITVRRPGGADDEEEPGGVQLNSVLLPSADARADGSLIFPIDGNADSCRMFARLDTSNVSGTMSIVLDASTDGGNTFACPCTAAITAVCGTTLQTISNDMGPTTVLAFNMQGNMAIIEGTQYPAPTTSQFRVCVCGTLADLHALRTEGVVAFQGNPTHLRFTYGGLPVVPRGAVLSENIANSANR